MVLGHVHLWSVPEHWVRPQERISLVAGRHWESMFREVHPWTSFIHVVGVLLGDMTLLWCPCSNRHLLPARRRPTRAGRWFPSKGLLLGSKRNVQSFVPCRSRVKWSSIPLTGEFNSRDYCIHNIKMLLHSSASRIRVWAFDDKVHEFLDMPKWIAWCYLCGYRWCGSFDRIV